MVAVRSLNLIYQDTVHKMGIDPSRISESNITFKGVIPGVEARCTCSLVLEVVFGSPDNFRSEELTFDIAPFRSGYHALLRRTAFARFNAVPHYASLKLKIPGPVAPSRLVEILSVLYVRKNVWRL